MTSLEVLQAACAVVVLVATIIGVTDSEMSPVYQMSSGSLLVRNEMISFVDSLAAPMSMLNALILAAAHKQGTDISATFNELEHVWVVLEKPI